MAHYYLDFMWSTHDWNQISNFTDFLRAITWCTANLVTAFCYLAIPVEIWYWRKDLNYLSTSLIGLGFMSFIAFCGLHHIVDVIIMQTAPWWAIWTVNIPMMLASLATWIFIRVYRQQIVGILRLIGLLVGKYVQQT